MRGNSFENSSLASKRFSVIHSIPASVYNEIDITSAMATLENGPTGDQLADPVKTLKKLSEKERAKLLCVAKFGPDHIPPKSGCELTIDEYHYVSRVQEMSTVWGNRIGVIIYLDSKEFCVYLGDTEKQKERFEALKVLMELPGYSLQMCLESIEQRSGEKARPVPHYDFRLVEADDDDEEEEMLTEAGRLALGDTGDYGKLIGAAKADAMVIDGKWNQKPRKDILCVCD